MRKISTIFILSMLIINIGIGTTASSDQNTYYKQKTVFFSQPIIIEKDQYIKININEANSELIKPNKPLLPMYTQIYTFPIGTQITDVSCTNTDIQQQTLDKKIITVPEPQQIGMETIKTKVFTSNDYEEPYPTSWYDYDIGCGVNDNREKCISVKVNVYPVKYYYSEDKIEHAENIKIKVEYIPPSQPPIYNEEYKFLILTPSQFSSELNSLVTHKNNRGISTKLVTLNEIYNGAFFSVQGRDDAEKVKYFIKNAYDDWGISYVLLVGDEDKFPARETHIKYEDDAEIFLSDLYYADIYDENQDFQTWDTNDNNLFCEIDWGNPPYSDEMDLYPDVAIGRLPCMNSDQLSTCINKITGYENNDAFSQSWFSNFVVVGGDSFPRDVDNVLEGEFVNTVAIDIMDGFDSTKLWASNNKLIGYNPTGVEKIRNTIDKGCGFVQLSGHGIETRWSTHPYNHDKLWLPTPWGGFFSGDVGDLENGNMLPVVVTGACSVSKYNTHDNCFSWSWITNPDGGGIASYGATALGWAYAGEWVITGLVEKMSLNIFEAYDDGAVNTGEMWTWAINNYITTRMEGTDYKTITEWALFGDPTLRVRSESLPPLKPEPPTGPNNGKSGTSYIYTAVTTDPDGDKISYMFNWGDGTYSEWLGPYPSGEQVEKSHTWTSDGNYNIRVLARDIHGTLSSWSDPSPVKMPIYENIFAKPKPGYLYSSFTDADGINLPFILGDIVLFIQRDITVSATMQSADKIEFSLLTKNENIVKSIEIQSDNGVFNCNFGKYLGTYKIIAKAYNNNNLLTTEIIPNIISISI